MNCWMIDYKQQALLNVKYNNTRSVLLLFTLFLCLLLTKSVFRTIVKDLVRLGR